MGLRVSEILGLRWGDFDWKKLEVRIQRAVVLGVSGQVKTIKSKAPMPVDQNLATVLAQHARRSNVVPVALNGWVFANPSLGKPWRPSHIQWKYIRPAGLAATGVDGIGWHNFRHTFSTMLRELGTDVKVQQVLLRHADVSTTLNVYTQGSAALKREAVGKVVNMVLPRINTEGQPALPLLPSIAQ
jgi:integrase